MLRFGLIGKPIGHSRSAKLFAERFARLGLEAHYGLYELETIEELPDLLKEIPELVGLNVTSPYKTDVLRYCQHLSPEVEALGAANVLVIREGGKVIVAHNTDVYGFEVSLSRWLGDERPERALVLGTGGAARAVGYVLHRLGIPHLYISRHAQAGQYSYADLEVLLPQHRLLVNATPVGLHAGEQPPIPYHCLTSQHLCYDLIYAPSPTGFMRQAQAQQARVIDGYAMLELQAEGAWRLWAQTIGLILPGE